MTCVWFLSLISKIDFDFSQMIHRFTSSQYILPTLSGAMELNGFTSDDWAIIQPLVSSLISRLISRFMFLRSALCEKWLLPETDEETCEQAGKVCWWYWCQQSSLEFDAQFPSVSHFCHVVIGRTVENELIQMWFVWGEITLETIEFLVSAREWCHVPCDTLKWYHELPVFNDRQQSDVTIFGYPSNTSNTWLRTLLIYNDLAPLACIFTTTEAALPPQLKESLSEGRQLSSTNFDVPVFFGRLVSW